MGDAGNFCNRILEVYNFSIMKGEFSMSKKLKNRGIVPADMSGKVFTSFNDLGSALGFSPSDPPTPKVMKCRKCGTVMRNIPNTNVWICDGVVEQEKDGAKERVVCGNRAITSVGPRLQSSENPGNSKSGKPKHQGKSVQAQTTT